MPEDILYELAKSLKYKKSNKRCKYVYQKGKNIGFQCASMISEAHREDDFCCKHYRHNLPKNIYDMALIPIKNTIDLGLIPVKKYNKHIVYDE